LDLLQKDKEDEHLAKQSHDLQVYVKRSKSFSDDNMSQTKKLRTEEVVGRVDIDEKIDEESKSSLSSKEENYDDIKLNLDKDKEDERQDGGAEQVNFNVYSISLYQHTQKDIKEIIKPCKIAVDDFELIITFLDKYNKDNE